MVKILKIDAKHCHQCPDLFDEHVIHHAPIYLIHAEIKNGIIDKIYYSYSEVYVHENFGSHSRGIRCGSRNYEYSKCIPGDMGGIYDLTWYENPGWCVKINNGYIIDTSTFDIYAQYNINDDSVYLGYPKHKNPILKVSINGLGNIVSVEIKDGIIEIGNVLWHNKLWGYCTWPSLCKILPLSNGEKAWRNIAQKLLDRQRIEHKMRPDGPFMTKLIERDQDLLE